MHYAHGHTTVHALRMCTRWNVHFWLTTLGLYSRTSDAWMSLVNCLMACAAAAAAGHLQWDDDDDDDAVSEWVSECVWSRCGWQRRLVQHYDDDSLPVDDARRTKLVIFVLTICSSSRACLLYYALSLHRILSIDAAYCYTCSVVCVCVLGRQQSHWASLNVWTDRDTVWSGRLVGVQGIMYS